MAELQYGIIRVQKVKRAALAGMGRHNDREGRNHSNPDIDPSRSGENRELIPHGSYEEEVMRRIEAGRTATTKLRKDAVVLVEGVVTASPEWFEKHGEAEAEAFVQDAFDFCKRRFGEDNLVHFTVHHDESTVHVHFGFVPLKDGSLSWKNYFNGAKGLRDLQDDFYREVSGPHGMARGKKRKPGEPVTRHRSVAEYKQDAARAEAEANAQAERLERLRRLNSERSREVARALAEQRRAAEAERRYEAENQQLAKQLAEVEQHESAARVRNSELRAERGRLAGRVGGLESRVGWLADFLGRARERLEKVRDRVSTVRDALWYGLDTLAGRGRAVGAVGAPELAEIAREMGFPEVVAEEAPAPRSAMAAAEWAWETQRAAPARDDPER